MEKFLAALDNLLQHVTFPRVLAIGLLFIISMVFIAAYENRQKVYATVISRTVGDYVLAQPSAKGKQLMQNLVDKYPNIAMISVIDADPISNRRTATYRLFNDSVLESIVKNVLAFHPSAGDSILFGADEKSNKEVLAVMAGEFLCTPNKSTVLTNSFPGSEKIVVYSCRVPLPPAFNKATGWFTLQLKSWPESRIEELKVDALSMSLTYYNTEILMQDPVK
jgi:hypothetical protein